MSALNKDSLKYLVEQLARKQKEIIEKITQTESYDYWVEHSNYIPNKGEIIFITNYKGGNDTVILVGDGETSILNLDLVSASIEKLQHTLTIGEHVFDGSADVTVEVYNGEMNQDELEAALFTLSEAKSLMTMQNLNNVTDNMTMENSNNAMTLVKNDNNMKQMLASMQMTLQ